MEKAKWDMLECHHQRITLALNLAAPGRLLTPYSAIFCPQVFRESIFWPFLGPVFRGKSMKTRILEIWLGKNVDTLCDLDSGLAEAGKRPPDIVFGQK